MVMGTCANCSTPWAKEFRGVSPMHVAATGLDVAVPADDVVHVYLYNPSLQGSPAGPTYYYASPDQGFTVQGTLSFAGPAGQASPAFQPS